MSVVYFISGGPCIKVGISTNLKSRFASLQTSSVDDLKLLGTIPGGIELERQIHARLKAYRKKGEWFADCTEVRKVVVELCGHDVFAFVEKEPEPEPLGDFEDKLSEILAATNARFCAFSKFCLEKCESDNSSKIWRLHVTKRYLIIAAITYASRCMTMEEDQFYLSNRLDNNAIGRLVANEEMCECQIEMILGSEDSWFLEGWERQPRSNPLFETDDGKLKWRTREEAAVDGWVAPPNSFQSQTAPWIDELLRQAA